MLTKIIITFILTEAAIFTVLLAASIQFAIDNNIKVRTRFMYVLYHNAANILKTTVLIVSLVVFLNSILIWF